MSKEEINKDTENKILEAAKNVFITKGMDGARMQNIADEAGINKSLLHYYYRSKERLFEAVFTFAFKQFMPEVADFFNSDRPVFDKIRLFTAKYIDVLSKNRYIPLFVLHEINKNPERMVKLIKKVGIKPMLVVKQIEKEIEAGIIKPMNPRQIIVNTISMCIFPIAAQPMIANMMFEGNNIEYDTFLEERKTAVAEFIIEAIKV